MRKRDLRLDKYGISNSRYRELRAFCLQYPEWKNELAFEKDAVRSVNSDGIKKGSSISDTTGNLAMRRIKLQEKCRIVDECLNIAGKDLKKYLYASVCEDKPLPYIDGKMQIPCERSTFYDMRRYFFYILDQKKDFI